MRIREITKQLRKLYPHGHRDFTDITIRELALHSSKNYDYAHGGDPLGNFKRVSADLKAHGINILPSLIALIYAEKQRDAVLWQIGQGYTGKVEGIDKKAEDVHVYWKLFRLLLEEEQDSPSRV